MGEVINILANQPHMSGPILCLHCNHSWTGRAPIGTIHMECPECKLVKAVFQGCVLPGEKVLFECNCGNYTFLITPTGYFCALCGIETAPDGV